MRQHVPPEHLWTEFQGDLEFEYDHAVYWPALIKLCEERHAEQKERWVRAGKNYGESETYLKGGSSQNVGEVAASEPFVQAVAGPEKEEDSVPVETANESSEVGATV